MAQSMLPAEVVISIIFGLLQLIVGLVSLWQQHYFRWAAHVEKEETLSDILKSQNPQGLTKFGYDSVQR
ncbi:hypothetical protein FOWG_08272 [Fusarium oxysporum f. sp. lycopersici MN25]|nr:hypothetical protein FOWG_08272 [Fusarium oxysporum f. sp. lycopersici MN25]